VLPECQCPHPRHSYGRCIGPVDASDDGAIRQHVKIIVILLPDGRERDARFKISPDTAEKRSWSAKNSEHNPDDHRSC